MRPKINKQKWLLMACLLMAAAAQQQVCAQGADTLYVQASSGAVQSFALNELRKLTFAEQNLNVQPASGSATVMPLASVVKMAFRPIRATATASSDATLSGITVSAGTLSPAFAAATYSYTVNVANSVSSISVTGTANHSAATVTGNVNNQALSVGSNPVTLSVRAENGATQSYTVTVVRAATTASSDATLSGITVSAGTLSPTFAAATYSYTVNVANSVSSISVTGAANHSAATVTGNVSSKSLAVGNNSVTLVVTAENGATQSYTVTVVRAASTSTAVASAQDYGLKIYPNPAVDNVAIESATDIREVRVFDAQGRLLQQVECKAAKVNLSLSAWPVGVYVLRIVNGQGVSVSKIIKQ
jgi:hypothetical protein